MSFAVYSKKFRENVEKTRKNRSRLNEKRKVFRRIPRLFADDRVPTPIYTDIVVVMDSCVLVCRFFGGFRLKCVL